MSLSRGMLLLRAAAAKATTWCPPMCADTQHNTRAGVLGAASIRAFSRRSGVAPALLSLRVVL